MMGSLINVVHSFINRISATHQSEEPPQFYGGIVADPMGLGKTLTMIALIATDLDGSMSTEGDMQIDKWQKHDTPATLVIIPPPRMSSEHPSNSDACLLFG